MTTRSEISPASAVGIWFATLIGAWAMAVAVLGAVNGTVTGCGPETGSGSAAGSPIVFAAALLPVMVMIAIVPPGWRGRLIGLAVVVAGVGLVTATVLIGSCL